MHVIQLSYSENSCRCHPKECVLKAIQCQLDLASIPDDASQRKRSSAELVAENEKRRADEGQVLGAGVRARVSEGLRNHCDGVSREMTRQVRNLAVTKTKPKEVT